MKQSRGFDVHAQMALLLAALGARFNKEDDIILERADYTHRKAFQDFFYYNVPSWRRTLEHLTFCFHRACQLNLHDLIPRMLESCTPEKVELATYNHQQVRGNKSLERAYQTNPGLAPIAGRNPEYFENMEKQSLVTGLTAAHMASAPQHELTAADQQRIREILEKSMRK